MTNEEHIEQLKKLRSFHNGSYGRSINKAIKALEQEPKYCDRNICLKNEYNGIGCDECEVTKSQEPKTGHWICIDDYHIGKFKCSVCQTEGFPNTVMYEPIWNYCPNCGARMKSEEKNDTDR